jgi:hypothetical protein
MEKICKNCKWWDKVILHVGICEIDRSMASAGDSVDCFQSKEKE